MVNIEKGAEVLWNLHAQTRAWDELNEVEKAQMRYEARFVVEAALPVITREELAQALLAGHQGGLWIKTTWEDLADRPSTSCSARPTSCWR